MANKPVTDAEAERWAKYALQRPDNRIIRLVADRTRDREVLRLWDDHLPGCSGSPRCECGYLEAQALLEVPEPRQD